MTLANLPKWAHRLVVEARVARLALIDAGDRPRVLPITYALAGDAIWTAIDAKPKRTPEPARVRWLRRRPTAAILIDRYSDDWKRLAWVQVLGRVTVLDATGASAAAGLKALAEKYEQYRADPPPGPMLRFDVERALHWRAEPAEP